MKKQLIIIHGGTTFDTYEEYMDYLKSCELSLEKINKKDWKDDLAIKLEDFEVIYPKMPNAKNARYAEWKIWFEKLIPLLQDTVVLIGGSLGAIFLVKYLAENKFPKNINSLHLVGCPFDAEGTNESLGDFALASQIDKISSQVKNINFYFSIDDPVVPFHNLEKYKKELPNANYIVFNDRKHFDQLEFPEIVENIRKYS